MKLTLFALLILLCASFAYYNATGGTITYDGNYIVHTFTANGSLNFTGDAINATCLIIAGGGGGGYTTAGDGGGGGAGGVFYNDSCTLSQNNYTVVVGIGGTVSAGSSLSGQNSSFNSMTAVGGGYGGHWTGGDSATFGANGGSGGGTAQGGITAGSANGTSGQGNNGGYYITSLLSGSGGGGAGEAGQNTTPTGGGWGGNGLNYSINGSSICYGGGGGGSTHSTKTVQAGGGCQNLSGGKGARFIGGQAATAGVNGTGGGGGGGGESMQGEMGGSGIVIVRYLTFSSINPSIINVTLTPAAPYTEDNLNCSFYTQDNDSATLNISALWIRNGINILNSTSAGQPANATYSFLLLAGNTSTGENWSCTGYAIDNTSLFGTANSSNATIRNDAPTISSMTLLPTTAYKLDTLTCSALVSDNNTAIVNATFRWYENGALQDTNTYSGTANTTFTDTSAGPHTQATTWICGLDAYDGDTHAYQNASVAISNHAPTISLGLLPSDPTDTSTMTCSITAGDSDNDALSGVIEWYINGTSLVNSSAWSGTPGSYSGTLAGLFTYGDNVSCFANATDTFDVISGWSVNRTVRNTTGYSTNFTFSRNYTFTDYESYITGFYDDWIGYILSLIAMAVSFILGKSYSQIFLMSGVGLYAVFILTGTAVILAGAVLLIIMSMLIKYVTGV